MDNYARELWLYQKSYVEKLLHKLDKSNYKDVNTLLTNHFKISLDQCPKTNVEAEYMSNVHYTNVIGYLMYVTVCTRPNLTQAISQVRNFMSKLGKHHWEEMKWIYMYLKSIMTYGILFSNE